MYMDDTMSASSPWKQLAEGAISRRSPSSPGPRGPLRMAGLTALALAIAVAGWVGFKMVRGGSFTRETCGPSLTRETVSSSIDSAAGYMARQQRPEGNFVYEYDWVTHTTLASDQQVRQAGAVWGAALIARYMSTPERTLAATKGLAFFAKSSRDLPDGSTLVGYPNENNIELGTVALIALAHIELLSLDQGLTAEQTEALKTRLKRLMKTMTNAWDPQGYFHATADAKTGVWAGPPSPYSDGEALLALIRATKVLGLTETRDDLVKKATLLHQRHVVEARKVDRDSDDTKGFYQWSTMAFYQLATSEWPGTEPFAAHVFDLADWVIDQHRILDRNRNTGYSVEGLMHAYDLAKKKGDTRAARYACVSKQILESLISWQVGGPTPDRFIKSHTLDPVAVGGIQNEDDVPAIRIDVVQHQTHAMLLARQWLWN
ncbi:MAG: hypothetical protein U0165_03255 [Polyangiaceae bacterium]